MYVQFTSCVYEHLWVAASDSCISNFSNTLLKLMELYFLQTLTTELKTNTTQDVFETFP